MHGMAALKGKSPSQYYNVVEVHHWSHSKD